MKRALEINEQRQTERRGRATPRQLFLSFSLTLVIVPAWKRTREENGRISPPKTCSASSSQLILRRFVLSYLSLLRRVVRAGLSLSSFASFARLRSWNRKGRLLPSFGVVILSNEQALLIWKCVGETLASGACGVTRPHSLSSR